MGECFRRSSGTSDEGPTHLFSWQFHCRARGESDRAISRGLRSFGYIEGKNISIEWRWAKGRHEKIPRADIGVNCSKCDVIVTAGTPASLSVKKATSTIPLVMIAVGDPVGTGLVASLAQLGGNITGLASIASDLEGKRLELLREVVPKISHIAVIWNPISPFQMISEKKMQEAARGFHIKVLSRESKAKTTCPTHLQRL
jgi:putative tryptophan/tyrosine transport system substrate-binding protein